MKNQAKKKSKVMGCAKNAVKSGRKMRSPFEPMFETYRAFKGWIVLDRVTLEEWVFNTKSECQCYIIGRKHEARANWQTGKEQK